MSAGDPICPRCGGWAANCRHMEHPVVGMVSDPFALLPSTTKPEDKAMTQDTETPRTGVKRFAGLLLDTQPHDAPPHDTDYVLASDYDDLERSLTERTDYALAADLKIAALEARVESAEAYCKLQMDIAEAQGFDLDDLRQRLAALSARNKELVGALKSIYAHTGVSAGAMSIHAIDSLLGSIERQCEAALAAHTEQPAQGERDE